MEEQRILDVNSLVRKEPSASAHQGTLEQFIVDMDSDVSRLESDIAAAESETFGKRSIYKVPELFAHVNREAYTPKLASIGPYHHGDDRLTPMEPHKRRALAHFQARGDTSKEKMVEELRQHVRVLMDSYDALDAKWREDEDSFLERMVIDGCFMLEVMLSPNWTKYDWKDPVFGKPYVLIKLRADMMLLENQLPLQVLSTLVHFGGDKMRRRGIYSIILSHFDQHVGSKGYFSNIQQVTPSLHMLDLYRNALLIKGNYSCGAYFTPRSAMKLREAGVSFRVSEQKGFKNIFEKSNGTLWLPRFDYDTNAEAIFHNLIAYEHVHGESWEVTAYVFFMDGLIDSAEDVTLLRKAKIIEKWRGTDDDVANFFNGLTKEVVIVINCAGSGEDVSKELSDYCEIPTHEWRAYFVRTYLRNPFVFMSLLAAIVLLVLTVIQTVFTIYPRH